MSTSRSFRAWQQTPWLQKHWKIATSLAVCCVVLALWIRWEGGLFSPLPQGGETSQWEVFVQGPRGGLDLLLFWGLLLGGGLFFGSLAWKGYTVGAKRNRLAKERWTLNRLQSMPWQDFERLSAAAFQTRGWSVQESGLGGADGGVDLLLQKGTKKAIAQCKRYSGSVGVKVARELLGEMHARGAQECFLVCASKFTRDAVAFEAQCAKNKNNKITLVSAQTLLSWLDGSPEALVGGPGEASGTVEKSPQSNTSTASSGARNGHSIVPSKSTTAVRVAAPRAPSCPLCQSTMRPLQARQGEHAGRWFWGCTRYPTCRGTKTDNGSLMAWAAKRAGAEKLPSEAESA